MTLEHMPGPDNARELQLKQIQTIDKLYSTLSDLQGLEPDWTFEQARNTPEIVALQQEYDQTVADLEALLGPDAHCNAVDCERWSTYSDWFKSEHGSRPRMHITRAEVTKALNT